MSRCLVTTLLTSGFVLVSASAFAEPPATGADPPPTSTAAALTGTAAPANAPATPLPPAPSPQDLASTNLAVRAAAQTQAAFNTIATEATGTDAKAATAARANAQKAAQAVKKLKHAKAGSSASQDAQNQVSDLIDTGLNANPSPTAQSQLLQAKTTANSAQTGTNSNDVNFKDGSSLHYGPTVSLLRFQTSRRADEPGRLRDYTPSLDLLPAQFGFQFVYRPSDSPWSVPLQGHKKYQLMSAGGMLLAHVDTSQASRGSLSLAATLGLFDDSIGLGVGFDLYRGIPVRGADGVSGSSTAYTGLLAAAFAREGELTPENVFVVVTLNLAWLTKTVAGEL